MTKKYGVRNTSECVFRFKLGKANITCRFTGGNLQSREPIPASYTTSNPIVQNVLESCEKFKNNHIFIMAEYGQEDECEAVVVEPVPAPAAPVVEKKPAPKKKATAKKEVKEVKVMEDVTTHGDAVTALMSAGEYGMSDLATIESCIAKAEEIGISFPNLKA